MTVLVALRDDKGNLHFGSDRRASWGFHKAMATRTPKSVKRGGLLLMGTGTCNIINEVMHVMDIPPIVLPAGGELTQQAIHDYFLKTFVAATIRHFRNVGYVKKDERGLNQPKGADSSAVIILGLKSELAEICISNEDIALDIIDAPYAHGCGGQLAHGALLATRNLGMSIEDRIGLAIQVAAEVSPGCDSTVDIINNISD